MNNANSPAMPIEMNSLGRLTHIGFTKREELAARFAAALLSNTVMGDSDLHSNPKWVGNIIDSGFDFADAFLSRLEETK